MDRTTDTEMSEMDESTASSSPPPPPNGGTDGVRDLLSLARRLIDQGNPSQALQAVMRALQTTGGIEAAVWFLARAQEMYRSRLRASTDVDQLSSLFAECVIAEVQSSTADVAAVTVPLEATSHGNSILSESGRSQVVLDAFADGSSFICLKCGGLVSNHRKDEHYAYWCG